MDAGKDTGEYLGVCVYLCARRVIWGIIIFDICKGIGVDTDRYIYARINVDIDIGVGADDCIFF